MELRIKYWEGYKVREDGVIFSKRNNKPLTYNISEKGYPCVSLHINGKPKFIRIHRLMAILFISNPKNKPNVNHKDRNRANYSLSNLEWCTQSENIIHSIKNGARKNWTRNNTGENNPRAKLNWSDIENIRLLYNFYGKSQSSIAFMFNTSQWTISNIVHKKIWSKKN